MKKPIGKRITGFLAAAALAVTTIGTSFVKPITAKAVSWRNALITVYDHEGHEEALDDIPESNYYALAMVSNNGSDPYKDSNGKWQNVAGWSLLQFHPEELYTGDIGDKVNPWDYVTYTDTSTDWLQFKTFYQYGTNGSKKDALLYYNSDNQKFTLRVYRTLDKSITLNTLADCEDTTKAADSIPGYTFGGDSAAKQKYSHFHEDYDTTFLAIKKYTATYTVKLDTKGKMNIDEGDKVFLRVQVNHATTGTSYFVKEITAADLAAGKIEVQTADSAQWCSQGGDFKANERISNTKNLTFNVVKYTADVKFAGDEPTEDELTALRSNIAQLNHCAIIGDGEIVEAAQVNYSDKTEESFDDNSPITEFVDTVTLTAVSAADNETFQTVLGNGIYYGITADRFYKKMHAETNFAANYYQQSGVAIEPDLSGDFGGHTYVAHFVNFNDKTVVDKDTVYYTDQEELGKIFIGGQCCKNGMVLHVDSINRVRDHRSFVAIEVETPDSMTNNVINPILKDMQNKSAALASNKANLTPYKTDKVYVDSTNYPADATIYVDGDALLDLIGGKEITSGSLYIKKLEGQLIVFNFTKKTEVDISEFDMDVTLDDGTVKTGKSSPSGGNGSDQNVWLDKYVTRGIVWNLNSVQKTTLKNTAGIFLNPNDKSEIYIQNTSTGWITSAGYVENNGDEWHFVYTGLPGATAPIVISKTDIVGSEEVEGATIEIKNDKGVTVQKWVTEKDKETGKTTRTFSLAPGTYTLVETAYDAPKGGKDYNIVPSEVTFTVVETKTTAKVYDDDKNEYVDKEITSATVVIDENSKNNKAAFTEDTDNGYFTKVNANTIRVNDAEKTADDSLSVKVSKVDIADGNEVAGAKLQILDASGETVKSWTSTTKPYEINGLEAGVTYTLRETVAPDGYLVATDITFTLDAQGKVTTTAKTTTDGVILVEDTMTKVSVSKVDIANGEELEGATIQIFDENEKVVEEWVSTNKAHEITGLKTGVTYTLRETVAPEGYAVATDTTFTIDEKGKVTSTGSVTEGGVLLVEDNMTSVKISKVDITDEKEVAGATLQILEDKKVVKEWKSGTTAQEITGLKTGVTYTLRETVAPEGYTVATDTTFTIGTDGKVTTTAKTTTDGTILVEDSKTSVKISKVDITDEKEVAGATLQILEDKKVVKEWKSGTTAQEITGLKTGVTYTLRETVAPEGYLVATDTTFTIGTDGKVTTTAKTTTDGTILVEDSKTSVKISKVDITDEKEVAGATLQILEDKKVVKEWKSGTTAQEITGLKTGVTYTLRETVAPEGYLVATDTTFTIGTDGKVTTTAKTTTDGTILVEDSKTSVKISKVDITDEKEVAGATLQILEDKKVVKEWKSGTTAQEITGLKTGVTYTLRETVAPEGYTVATDTTFTIGTDGKVTTTAKTTTDGTILVEDSKTSVKVSKVDIADGKEVEGAHIQVLEGTTVVDEWDSTKTAHEIIGLKTGVTYTLRETVAPEGYNVATDTDFTIGANGKVASKTTKMNADGVLLVEDAATSDTVVTVSKKEINGKDELAGAKLTIKDSEGNVVKTWTSGNVAEKVALKDGTYTLEETGDEFTIGNKTYKVTDSTVEFTVKNGEVTSSKVTEGTIGKITVDGTNITVEDAFEEKVSKDTDVTISKKEINGKDELEGATLTIKDSEGNVVKTWTSGKTAVTVTLKDGTYTLEETGDGFTVGDKTYKVTDSTVEFTVEDGEVTSSKVTEGTIGKITVDGTHITVEDVYEETSKDTDVTISKKEINGKDELEGATLTIKDSEGNVVKTWTSGKTAVTVTLKDGTYTLEETGDGFTVGDKTYKVTDSTVEFTVKNGEVTSSKVTEGTIGKITVEGTHITVEDVYEEKQSDDEKKDEEDEKKDDEKSDDEKSDDEKKDDEQSDDEKKDDEQSDDEKKDDEQSDDEKKDDEQSDDEKKDEEQSDDEKKDEEQSDDEKKDEEDKKSDDKKSDSNSDSDSESQDNEDTGSGDADTNDSSTSDGNDNDGDQTGSGGATTTTTNATTGNGGAFPVALAFACLATVIFKKKNED